MCDRRAGHGAAAARGNDQVVSRAGKVKRVLRADDVGRTGRRSRERYEQAGGERREAATTKRARFIVNLPSGSSRRDLEARPLPGRYRPATVTSRARVPCAGAARGRRRRRPDPARRAAAAGDAGDPAASAPTALCRSSGWRTSSTRTAAGFGGDAGAAPGLRAAPRARLRRSDRDAAARLFPSRPRRGLRPRPLRAADGGGRAGLRAGGRRGGARCCARRSACGAARRSPTSRTSRSRARRASAWRSCASRRSRSGSRRNSRSAATRRSSPSSRRSLPSTRCASGSAASRCSRSTARGGRPRRSRRTARRGRRSSRASGSSRRSRCRRSSARS